MNASKVFVSTCCLFAASAALPAAAATITTVTGDTSDARVVDSNRDGSGNSVSGISGGSVAVGYLSSGSFNAGIFAFDLPELPTGEALTDASLQINVAFTQLDDAFTGSVPFEVDLFGLTRTSNTSAVLASDYFSGDASSATDGLLLADNAISSSDGNGAQAFDVAAFLAAQYAAFGPGHDFSGNDDFVFFRFNADESIFDPNNPNELRTDLSATATSTRGLTSANNGTVANRPALVITSEVPEPGSMLLVGAGAVLIAGRRRRLSA
ncbi:MAG: PEP-CTERM sorting domain-containing protein [Planctomycetota bacterium]